MAPELVLYAAQICTCQEFRESLLHRGMSDSKESLCSDLRAASKRIHSISNSLLLGKLVVLFTDRVLYGRALACFVPIFEVRSFCFASSTHAKAISYDYNL